jgi:hypothetical protein
MQIFALAATATLALFSSCVNAAADWEVTLRNAQNMTLTMDGGSDPGSGGCLRLKGFKMTSVIFASKPATWKSKGICCMYMHMKDGCTYEKGDSKGFCGQLIAGSSGLFGEAMVKSIEVDCMRYGDDTFTPRSNSLTPNLDSFYLEPTKYRYQSKTSQAASGTCNHANECGYHSGECEDYCGSRGFSHMTGDGCGWKFWAKKCCCIQQNEP